MTDIEDMEVGIGDLDDMEVAMNGMEIDIKDQVALVDHRDLEHLFRLEHLVHQGDLEDPLGR